MTIASVLTLSLITVAPGFTESTRDTYPKNPNIDILDYRFSLLLNDSTDVISGTAVVSVRFKSDGITQLRLDLTTQVDGKGMRVVRIHEDAANLAFSHNDDVLLIDLSPASVAGETRRVTVIYTGVPATGLIIAPNKHGDRTFFSDNWPNKARNWLPTVDHPYDKATCEFIVVAPQKYQVVSNGLLVEETDRGNNQRLTHWRETVPIATWLFAIGVAQFAVQYVGEYDGIPIQTWVYPQDRDAGFHDFAVPTQSVLEFYSERIGPYSYEKLANVQSNSVGGGMEAASTPFYGDASVTGNRSVRWRNVVIHEIAHQWFGNAVTEYDWDDVWLSEGFATYFTLLFIEHAYGRDEFVRGLTSSADRVFTFYRDRPNYRIVHDNLSDMTQVTSSQTYQKGGWILHMLRGLLGDDVFWNGIQLYYRRHWNANASTIDFRNAMEEVAGRELDWFFQQWLYQGGNLKLSGGWRYEATRGQLIVEVAQTQADGFQFAMPIQLGVFEAGRSEPTILEIDITETQHRFVFDFPMAPNRVELDPYLWILMEREFEQLP